MARYKLIARSNAVDGREADYNAWYDGQHMPDMLNIPGIVAFERFVSAGEGAHQFLTILEIETDDLDATMAEVFGRGGTDLMPMTDAIDLATVDLTVWSPYGK